MGERKVIKVSPTVEREFVRGEGLFWIRPGWMFIGEAPGIHGCVKTGIPFTSERLIQGGDLKRYFPAARFEAEGNKAEGTATVVWRSGLEHRVI